VLVYTTVVYPSWSSPAYLPLPERGLHDAQRIESPWLILLELVMMEVAGRRGFGKV